MERKEIKLLGLGDEKTQAIIDLIQGKTDPEEYSKVRDWVSQCYNPPTHEERLMEAFNQILDGYGIESWEGEWRNGYWCNIVGNYVNLGDTYILTIVHHRDKGFIVSSWGDIAEKDQ